MPIPTSLLVRRRPATSTSRSPPATWPADLTGEMVISAPLPDPDLAHGFFGFGDDEPAVAARPASTAPAPGKLAWRTKVIDSPSRRLYERPPRRCSPPDPPATPRRSGPPNMANTAPLPWGDRLFATWDVGRPSELDPVEPRAGSATPARSTPGADRASSSAPSSPSCSPARTRSSTPTATACGRSSSSPTWPTTSPRPRPSSAGTATAPPPSSGRSRAPRWRVRCTRSPRPRTG